MGGVIGPGLLAVVDDVDSRLHLFFHVVFYRARHGGIEITRISTSFLLGRQQIDHLLRARQAFRVGRGYSLRAALHGLTPFFLLKNRPLAFAPFFLLHRLFLDLVEALEADQILYPLAGGHELLMRHARVIARLAHFL